jgi:hypothetical protein
MPSEPMFIVHCHNAHGDPEDTIYGPLTEDKAKKQLVAIVKLTNDAQFTVHPYSAGRVAGYEYDDLFKAGRNTDLSYEVWSAVEPIYAPFEGDEPSRQLHSDQL